MQDTLSNLIEALRTANNTSQTNASLCHIFSRRSSSNMTSYLPTRHNLQNYQTFYPLLRLLRLCRAPDCALSRGREPIRYTHFILDTLITRWHAGICILRRSGRYSLVCKQGK